MINTYFSEFLNSFALGLISFVLLKIQLEIKEIRYQNRMFERIFNYISQQNFGAFEGNIDSDWDYLKSKGFMNERKP